MNFASDNTSGASPAILDAILRANADALPSYGADPYTRRAGELMAEAFGGDPAMTLVATGTAANALALASVVPPGGVVFCHEAAHIIDEECAAPEFYTHGGKLVGVAGAAGKIDPAALRATLKRFPIGIVRQAQPACLSLSQATESGTVYSLAELRVLTGIAHEAGLAVHMDGARFSNALVSLGCSPAAMSREAGIDVLSFGATKNGTLACEAVLVFDAGRGAHLPFLQKRGGHVLSKGRFLGAQLEAYLNGGLWLQLAGHANAMAQRLAGGLAGIPGVRMPWRCDVNELFPILPTRLCAGLKAGGVLFYDWDTSTLQEGERPLPDETFVRFVCSFATKAEEVDAVLALARRCMSAEGERVATLPY